MTAGTVEFEFPAGCGAKFVVTATPGGFVEPQAGAGIDQVTDSPRREEFVNQFRRNAALEWFVHGVIDPKRRGTDGATAGAASFATLQYRQIVLHVNPIRYQLLRGTALRRYQPGENEAVPVLYETSTLTGRIAGTGDEGKWGIMNKAKVDVSQQSNRVDQGRFESIKVDRVLASCEWGTFHFFPFQTLEFAHENAAWPDHSLCY